MSETVCVTGAAGFIGSWLVMRLLERGYTVRATVRDPGNMKKVKHLLQLPKADTHLTLWKADLAHQGSFDDAINGCSAVFHVATPVDFDSKDPEASPVIISGRKVFVEEKRSTNRGNGRPRFSSGRGAGYRNEGGRGHGNHVNGRNYGRGDFSRPESGYKNGNRGGYSSRGNNGFQRVDRVGNHGGRVNRNGGLAINSMAKATSVPAPA